MGLHSASLARWLDANALKCPIDLRNGPPGSRRTWSVVGPDLPRLVNETGYHETAFFSQPDLEAQLRLCAAQCNSVTLKLGHTVTGFRVLAGGAAVGAGAADKPPAAAERASPTPACNATWWRVLPARVAVSVQVTETAAAAAAGAAAAAAGAADRAGVLQENANAAALPPACGGAPAHAPSHAGLSGEPPLSAHVIAASPALMPPAEYRAHFLLGCDGGASTVRKGAGIGFEGDTFPDQPWLVVDVETEDAGILATWTAFNFICDPARPFVHVPVPGNTGFRRFEFMLHPWEAAPQEAARMTSDASVAALLRTHAHVDASSVRIRRVALYTFHAREATAWRVGPVLLAGDAAHCMPPFRGQGLCAGLRDAGALCWRLAHVVHGLAGEEALLPSYEAERRPHLRAVTRVAVAMGRLIALRSKALAAVRDVLIGFAYRFPLTAPIFKQPFAPPTALDAGLFDFHNTRGLRARRELGPFDHNPSWVYRDGGTGMLLPNFPVAYLNANAASCSDRIDTFLAPRWSAQAARDVWASSSLHQCPCGRGLRWPCYMRWWSSSRLVSCCQLRARTRSVRAPIHRLRCEREHGWLGRWCAAACHASTVAVALGSTPCRLPNRLAGLARIRCARIASRDVEWLGARSTAGDSAPPRRRQRIPWGAACSDKDSCSALGRP
jgi:2-polyprenyl-6-methoxyphenol hydroxylase-like FAD-dependent oxidoreductase